MKTIAEYMREMIEQQRQEINRALSAGDGIREAIAGCNPNKMMEQAQSERME